MTLSKCPECSRDVSDKATACPHSTHPFARTPPGLRSVHVIEQTGRRWKAIRALGWLLIVCGVLVLFTEWAADDFRGVALGWWVAGTGVACLWIGRAGAWWYHG
jgi:hypothetical protein